MNTKELVLSGVFTGISGIFARLGMKDTAPGLQFLAGLIYNPMLLLASAFGIAGFVYLQRSLYRFNVSFASPVASSIAIMTPVLLAIAFLDERISWLRWIGIGLIILGVVGMAQGTRGVSKNLNPRLPRKRL